MLIYYREMVLEELNKKNIELALRFRTLNQFKALEILGKENAELALKFTDSQQVEALELIPTTLLLADIKCIEQINAIVNGHSFEEAIAISCPQEDAHVTTAGDIVSE